MKKNAHTDRTATKEQNGDLLGVLKNRFEKNPARHRGIVWADVEKRLSKNPEKLATLAEMEKTGGEPDVILYSEKTGEYTFFDCSPESPKGRVGFCYDREALDSRKEHKPKNNIVDFASAMGVELMTESQYIELQKHGEFDLKTSSWLKAPQEIRELGGALFGDRRYGRVFIYHNGAQSYYSARGFRATLTV